MQIFNYCLVLSHEVILKFFLILKSVKWLSVKWLSVKWLSVKWLSVKWLSVKWLSVKWLSKAN